MVVTVHMMAEAIAQEMKRAQGACVQGTCAPENVSVLEGAPSGPVIAHVRPYVPDGTFGPHTLYVREDQDGHGCALLLAKDQAPASELVQVITVAGVDAPSMFALAADALDALVAWDQRMLEAMAARKTLTDLLALGAKRLANPVALFDSSTALIGYAGTLPDGYEDTIWGAVVTRGYAPLSYYAADERERVGQQLLTSRHPHVFHPKREHGRAHVTTMAMVDERPYAMLSQVDLMGPFTQGQLDTLAHVRDRIEQLASASVGSARHASPLEHCLRLLLESSPVEESLARYHLGTRGWHLDDAYALLCGIPHEEMNEVSLRSLCERVRATLTGALVLMHQGSVVALVQGEIGEQAHKRLDDIARKRNVVFGLSSTFMNFLDSRMAHAQALSAIRLASPDQVVVTYGEVFDRRVRELLADGASTEELCHHALLTLVRSGDPHGQDYLRTLYVYLLCGCNVAKAAKRLYLHRNTLEYRLDRMAKRTGIALADPSENEQLRLMLSCLLLRMNPDGAEERAQA